MGQLCAAGASGSSSTGLWAQICRGMRGGREAQSSQYTVFLLTLERVLTEGSSQEGGIQSSAKSAEDGTQGFSHARQTLCH